MSSGRPNSSVASGLKAIGRRKSPRRRASRAFHDIQLPLLGSNQDSPDPESGVLPVTPRGTDRIQTEQTPVRRPLKIPDAVATINPFGLPLADRPARISLVQQPRISRLFSPSKPVRRLAFLAAAALLSAACGRGPSAFGATPAEARNGASDFFGALALRFGPLSRTPKLEEVRPRLVRHSLSPSKIFEDSALWSSRSGTTRTMLVAGSRTARGGYLLAHRPQAASPERPGDGRATIQLAQLGAGEYGWHSIDELAVGGTSAADLGTVLVRTFAAIEGVPGPAIRAGYRQALPHTTAALGRYITLDSIRSVRQADGASLVSFTIRLDPKRLEATMPHFAKYARDYISPARYRITLTDRTGALWLEAVQDDDLLNLRSR